ncbi:PREDICTED: pentatricopeptide repeat-containing protein At3g13150-like [Nicotiana attenuata]|uniref:Pentatricopeptide repeat-containing protein n=1 Tax=Nicotiana attenuata TaxID=49451 RepID=A0A1J6ID84_NICAT|nr:PREDICTED: pentatricopeptide repeat-containing protein At3g13150-like [Nicotiana attenuata]OIT02356.1 pentatricopeptide repeat-containing protein [Nicotiana attenuata]
MSSSLYRRLHGVFTNTAKSQVLTAIADAKPKVPPPFNPISEAESSKEQKFRPLIRKFKYLSKDPRFRRRHVNYESFIRRLGRTQQFSAIEDILEHQKIYPEIEDEGFVVRLISLYGKAGMFEQARRLFDEMADLNCERTIISFNALLAACVNSKKYDKISEIFKELPGKLAIEPDVISYNTVIKALCEMGSLHSAVLVMKEMEKNGIDTDVVTFNTLLDAFHKNNMSSEAEKMWTLMEKKNVISNVRSYNSRIRWLVENNQVVEAEELFEKMKKRGVNPDIYSHNSMIKACAKDGNLELAKSWYVKLEENGCVPNRPTFELLITLACDKDDPDSAYDLCKKSINLKLNVFTGTIQRVVDTLVDHSMIEEAKELLEIGKNCPFRYKLSMPNDLQ